MKFGLSKTAIAISSPSPGHLKTQRKKLEKPKQNTGYGLSGRKNDPKRPRDPNQLAKSIIDIATGQKPDRDPTPEEQGKVTRRSKQATRRKTRLCGRVGSRV